MEFPARRILSATRSCYLDDSNGAAVATRSLLQSLQQRGFATEVLCGSTLDLGPELDLGQWLTERRHGFEDRAGEAQTDLPPHFRILASGMPVTLHRVSSTHPHPPDEAESSEFLRLFDAAVTRFKPDVLLTYGGDPTTQEILSRARRLGITTVFALHNFNYHNRRPFADADAILVPSRFAAEHYRKTLGISCTVLPNFIDLGSGPGRAYRAGLHDVRQPVAREGGLRVRQGRRRTGAAAAGHRICWSSRAGGPNSWDFFRPMISRMDRHNRVTFMAFSSDRL
jgi:hypothetical protein